MSDYMLPIVTKCSTVYDEDDEIDIDVLRIKLKDQLNNEIQAQLVGANHAGSTNIKLDTEHKEYLDILKAQFS